MPVGAGAAGSVFVEPEAEGRRVRTVTPPYDLPRSGQVARVVNQKFHIIHGPANAHEGLVPECQRQRLQQKAQRQALIDSAHAVAAAAAMRPPPLPTAARPLKTTKRSWRKWCTEGDGPSRVQFMSGMRMHWMRQDND